jgi:type IV pilus assembly protein PilA
MHTLRQRLNVQDESAFTLIELLVVLIIIGVLLAIAIPSYLGFQKKAQQTAAASDVRSAIPDAEQYYSDQNPNAYTGMSANLLNTQYDSGLVVSNGTTHGVVKAEVDPAVANDQGFCISAVNSGYWAHINGPGNQVVEDGTAGDQCP